MYLRCAALDGHPAAQLTWQEPADAAEEGR